MRKQQFGSNSVPSGKILPPYPDHMRSLVWLSSKLIAEVLGLYALLTCSDKPIASFGAKRDFSFRSAAPTCFQPLLQGEPLSAPSDHSGWSVSLSPGTSIGNSFLSFTSRAELIMGHREVS